MKVRVRGYILEKKGKIVVIKNAGTGMEVQRLYPYDHELDEMELRGVGEKYVQKMYGSSMRNKDRYIHQDGQR